MKILHTIPEWLTLRVCLMAERQTDSPVHLLWEDDNQFPWISNNKPDMKNRIVRYATCARLPASGSDQTGPIRATIAGMTAKRERRSERHPGGVNIILLCR